MEEEIDLGTERATASGMYLNDLLANKISPLTAIFKVLEAAVFFHISAVDWRVAPDCLMHKVVKCWTESMA